VVVVHAHAAGVWLGAPQSFSPAAGSPFPVRGELLAVCLTQNRLLVTTTR
jgi:hypothetical protein